MRFFPLFVGRSRACFSILAIGSVIAWGTFSVMGDAVVTNALITQSPSATNTDNPNAPTVVNWTVDGRDYHNVKIGKVEADRVHITYDGGIGTVPLADLPPELQKRFNYDPAAAKAITQQREQQAAQSDAQVYAMQAQTDKQQAQAAAVANSSQRAELEKQIKACTDTLRYDEKSVYGQSWNAVDKARAERKVADDQAKLDALQAKLANLHP